MASVAVLLALGCALAAVPLVPAPASAAGEARIRLVTFTGPGTAGHRGPAPDARYRDLIRRRQDVALAQVDAPAPIYRWTTALSGAAVELTEEQAAELGEQPSVAAVEDNAVRPLAGVASPVRSTARGTARQPAGHGGTGVVIGVVDTGIWPESPLFADSPALGRRPERFSESCPAAEDWDSGTCNAKLVAARAFVAGFGPGRVAADEPLSPRDVRGHGTEVASIAAGNSGVDVGVPGLPSDYRGTAPRARVAAYKACWSAPDPDDDGCSTADLVAAIDAATADGVDVLNLSVAGAAGIDTVERALLGATEAGIAVVAAAGNPGADGYATHVAPWVTTVGALDNPRHAGDVSLGGRRLDGVMTARRPVRARAVAARRIPAAGHSVSDAAACLPGSLNAARAADRIVVCERGTIGRVAKSDAVARADGVGMVLVNTHRGGLAQDLHAVPTVHLGRDAGRTLLDWLHQHPRHPIALEPRHGDRSTQRVAPSSPSGDPTGTTLKPDLVADGTGVLAGVPPTVSSTRWAYLSGTSAASAWTSGAVATLLARHHWTAPEVRSVLAGSGRGGPDTVLRAGAGQPRLGAARRGRLAHDVEPGDYRAWLAGRRNQLNTPSLLFHGAGTGNRRLTNVGDRTDTWRVEVSGFERYDVTVSPASVTLRPGQSASYHVTVSGGTVVGGLDEGAVTWVAGDGSRVRVPVAIGR